MKALILQEAYGLNNLRLVEKEKPALASHEVLVEVKAVSLNRLDLIIAQGLFGTQLPHIPGSDAAGVVVATGAAVREFKQGDRVVTHFIQDWQSGTLKPQYLQSRLGTDVQGVISEYIALPEKALVKAPAHLTHEEAATLPIAALTAWEALTKAGKLSAGQTVLLQGTGGVSIFALQFAKMMGARVIISSGSDAKLARAKAMGADETLNYLSDAHWQEQVKALTGGVGVDLALEMSWTGLAKTLDATKLGGTIVVVGLLGGAETQLNVFGIMQKSITLRGIQVGAKESFEEMNQAIAVNGIRPVIDKGFALTDFAEAFRYFDKSAHFGKVVLMF